MTSSSKLKPMGLLQKVTFTNKQQFGEELIDLYLSKGFGKMNKNDFEVLFFHLLMKHSCLKEKNSFMISTILKIPESKVKRLIYEAQLNYCDYHEDDMVDNLKRVFEKAYFRDKENKISFAVSDKMLRSYISSFLIDNGHFSDSSFNSDIVVVHIETFAFLLEKLCYTEDESIKIMKNLQKKFPDKHKRTFSELLKKCLDSAFMEGGKVLADKIISNLFNLSKFIEVLQRLNF